MYHKKGWISHGMLTILHTLSTKTCHFEQAWPRNIINSNCSKETNKKLPGNLLVLQILKCESEQMIRDKMQKRKLLFSSCNQQQLTMSKQKNWASSLLWHKPLGQYQVSSTYALISLTAVDTRNSSILRTVKI